MKQLQRSSIVFETFSSAFRKHAHLLVAWGYENAKSQINTDDEETITGLIYQEIKNILRFGYRGGAWCSNYAVKNEDPITGGIRTGKDRRATDLIIEFVTQKGHPEYIFEAKPLNYPKAYQREGNYTDEKGMCRFIQKGEYAEYTQNYPEVGMLGYVLSNSNEYWCIKLKRAILKKRSILRLKNQSDITVIENFPTEWISEHNRELVERPLNIYHILLDCRKITSDTGRPCQTLLV